MKFLIKIIESFGKRGLFGLFVESSNLTKFWILFFALEPFELLFDQSDKKMFLKRWKKNLLFAAVSNSGIYTFGSVRWKKNLEE